MLTFPNAKINLGLNVIARRPDGYHDIESCLYPIPFFDVLEIIPSEKFIFTSSGLDIPGDREKNLCVRAYYLLAKSFDLRPVHIHLHKVIPMGAGLGGGSADGAFTLVMLNEMFELQLSVDTLEELAGQLGSDCPFFIQNKPVFATGRGAEFQEIKLDLSGKFIALKHPGIHIRTKEAYSRVIPTEPKKSISKIIEQPIETWKNTLVNDFEKAVFPSHSELLRLKEELYQKGALYASMTGSGSAIYGIFEEKPDLKDWKEFKF